MNGLFGSLVQTRHQDAALMAQGRAMQQQQAGLVGLGQALRRGVPLSSPEINCKSKDLSFKEELQKEIDDWLKDI